jgi:serine/threonine-protein kinase
VRQAVGGDVDQQVQARASATTGEECCAKERAPHPDIVAVRRDKVKAMQEPVSSLGPGTPVGDYEVTGTIGRGGMGTVYAGVHPIIGKRVAIKCLNERLAADSASLKLFINEARAVNAIGHEGIVDIFNIGQLPDGRPYLVMEFLDGETLADRALDRAAPLAFGETCAILDAVLSALEAAHQKGFVHRDLKPENVMLLGGRAGTPKVKLLDFGIAKLVRPDGTSTTTSQPLAVGTPSYMAPEQCLCEPVDARTDLYSFGVMMYLLYTGRLPFVSEVSYRVLEGHVSRPPPRPRDWAALPPGLEDLILDCMEKKREQRPSSAGEVRARLAAIAAQSGNRPARRKSPRSRRIWLAAGAGAVLTLLAGVAIRASRPSATPPAPPAVAPAPPAVAVAPAPQPVVAPPPAVKPPPAVAPAPEKTASRPHASPPRRAAAPPPKRPALDDIGDFPAR